MGQITSPDELPAEMPKWARTKLTGCCRDQWPEGPQVVEEPAEDEESGEMLPMGPSESAETLMLCTQMSSSSTDFGDELQQTTSLDDLRRQWSSSSSVFGTTKHEIPNPLTKHNSSGSSNLGAPKASWIGDDVHGQTAATASTKFARTSVLRDHTWIRMCSRAPGEPYTGCQRLIVVFSGVCCALSVLIVFMDAMVRHRGVSTEMMVRCIVTSAISMIPMKILLKALFEQSYVRAGHFLAILVQVSTMFTTPAYTRQWNITMQRALLFGGLMCAAQDIAVNEPLQILLRTAWRAVCGDHGSGNAGPPPPKSPNASPHHSPHASPKVSPVSSPCWSQVSTPPHSPHSSPPQSPHSSPQELPLGDGDHGFEEPPPAEIG